MILKKTFTLIEILMAVFILAIGLISLLAVFPKGVSLGTKVTDKTMSTIILRNGVAVVQHMSETIEIVRVPSYAVLPHPTGGGNPHAPYTLYYKITNPSFTAPNLYKVTLKATIDEDGQSKDIQSAVTYISQRKKP